MKRNTYETVVTGKSPRSTIRVSFSPKPSEFKDIIEMHDLNLRTASLVRQSNQSLVALARQEQASIVSKIAPEDRSKP